MAQDFRYALRMLGNNPVFTVVAIMTIALGIGANTAIFSLMNAFVLRPLRVKDPDQLVMITEARIKQRGRRRPTEAAYLEWKRSKHSFEDIAFAGFGGDPTTLSGIGHAERISGGECGINFFSVLGVKAFRGRLFLPEDAPHGQSTTVVISERLWQRMFAADPNILGQAVVLEGEKKTIIGVLPPGFSALPWDMNVDVWFAFGGNGPSSLRWLPVIGRLKRGVSMQRSQAELNAIAQGMQPHLDADRDWSVRVESLHEAFVQGARGYFNLLLGAVGFVLLIACANIANLLLARGATRQREMAIRASLGAGRWRLIRQLLAESLLLALLGGAIGVLVGFWGMRILVAIAPIDQIRSLAPVMDLRVLGFTLALALLTGILFGLVPALRFSNPNLSGSLKAGRIRGGGGPRQRSQGLLLVSEVGLAVVLLIGAGLMISSFVRLQKVDIGFNPHKVLRADVFLDGPKFWHNTPGKEGFMKTITPQGDVFFRQLLERVESIPGVASAGISHLAPPGDLETRTFRIIGRPVPAPGHELRAGYNDVSAGYFGSLAIPLLKGRYVTERDVEG